MIDLAPPMSRVHLRAYRLVCALTFDGKRLAFAPPGAFERVIAAMNATQQEIVLVCGPDDVCGTDEHDIRNFGKNGRYDSPLIDGKDVFTFSVLSRLNGAEGTLAADATYPLTAGVVAGLRFAYAHGSFFEVCRGCSCAPHCQRVAARGFQGALLYPPKKQIEVPVEPKEGISCQPPSSPSSSQAPQVA